MAEGDVRTYTLEIINAGPVATTNVTVNDVFGTLINSSAGATGAGYISHTIFPGAVAAGSITCSTSASGSNGRQLSCTIPTLPVCTPGTACPRIQVAVRPGGDGGTRSNSATAVSTTAANPAQGNSVTTAGNRLVRCTLGTQNNGVQRTVAVRVRPTTGTRGSSLASTAVVSTTTTEPNTPGATNNAATDTTTVGNPSLDLLVNNIDSVDPLTIGDTTAYTTTVSNAGPSTSLLVRMRAVSKGVYTNTASVASDESGLGFETTANNTAPQATTVRTRVDMQVVSKVASSDTVALRRPFTWTSRVRNNPGAGYYYSCASCRALAASVMGDLGAPLVAAAPARPAEHLGRRRRARKRQAGEDVAHFRHR